ncbi:MAG: ParB/RepB/Spo0J family partition protein [Solirubrobacterales bacterium]|nr:ParB/RepB/Spo0J family partition protein [Solirubrobacterales bacterium]
MAEQSRGMGRGLAAILSTGHQDEEAELRELPVELIAANPDQPRRTFDEQALAGLAHSVQERGVLQPVLVRPLPGGTYELIAGERRWRAAQLAGLDTVPAIVRSDDDATSLELALIENMAREDLNPLEEARACAALVEELGLTREEVGRRVGRSRVAVSNLLRLLDLPDLALMLIDDGSLSEGHGRALLMAPDHDARRRLAREAATKGWSVRQTEDRARAAAGRGPEGLARREHRPAHPDQVEAVMRLGEVFGRASGADVRVTPQASGYRVQLAFDSLEDALAAAERMGLRTTV